MLKKVFKIFLKILLSLLVLLLVLWILLQTTFFQNFLIHRITKTLSKNLNTTVSIKHVDFDLFNRMVLENTLVLDKKKDTLLYAGALRVNITDWFFLKDKIVLNYVGLDDAIIRLNRKTPEWNYQFLIDYFGGNTTSGKTESKPLHLDARIIHLKNTRIYQEDAWVGTNMFASVKDLRIDAEKLDLNNMVLNINQIQMDHPVFAQYDYNGLRPPDIDTSNNANNGATQDSVKNNNEKSWMITVKKITINQGKVAVEKESENLPVMGQFDDSHIILSELNATIKNAVIKSDTLRADLDFSVKDRGGFRIKKFNSKFKMAPGLMEFTGLDLQTDKSRLGNYFAMHYHSFNEDMNDFIHAVKMEGRFDNATLNSDDLGYFAPDAKSWGRVFTIRGNVSGKVENLTASNFSISSGNQNILQGDMSLRGLPDINETFIDLRIKEMRTTYPELAKLIPSLHTIQQPNISAFGRIKYTGSFTGYFNDFVTFGDLNTDIGNLKTDLHLKVKDNEIPVYSGKLTTTNFDLGRFIHNNQIGTIAFNGKIDGKGFKEKYMNISVDGAIQRVVYNGYSYTNIIAHGDIKKDLFSGSASIDDPNIVIDTLVGTINFGNKNPYFNFFADVLQFNLKDLGFTKDDISLIGRFNFDFKGKTIDDFIGSTRVSDARLWDNGKQLSFDSLVIASSVYDSSKLLSLTTNELEASINGNFKIRELKEAFLLFLHKYYPAYIPKPKEYAGNQSFSFMIHTNKISEYVNLLDHRISGLNDALIIGNIDIKKNIFGFNGNIPQLNFSNIRFNDIAIESTGGKDSLTLVFNSSDVIINDSLHSPGTQLSITASNDVSKVNIQTSANKTLNSANINAEIRTKQDGFSLIFLPSTFALNQKLWTIQKGGEIQLIGKMITAHQVRFHQNNQEISVSTHPSDIGNSNDIYIQMQDIIVEDIMPLVLKYPRLQGLLSGDVIITDPFNNAGVSFKTTMKQFIFETDSIGVVKSEGNFSNKTGMLNASLVSDNDPYRFKGKIGLNVSDSTSPISGEITFDQSGIHLLGNFLTGIVSDVEGKATGKLELSGILSHPELTGSIQLDNTSMTIDYTKCRYTMDNNSVITFNPDEIDFGTITLNDAHKKKAILSGKIYHNFFDNFFFNELHIKTNDNFQLLNTTLSDNKDFYGNVRGRAELSLNGFVTDMRMSIKGEPTDSSNISLPIGESVESGGLNYIEFTQFGREMTVDTRARENTNIKVDMELTANPLAKIDVILDETTGDVIQARGNGKLFITAGTTDPLTIRGRYNVQEGDYTFNFQTVMKTPFSLQQGYIEWQGDPYLAQLNIDAVYRAKSVNLDNIPTSTGLSNTTGDIDILFKLRGTLKNPSPQFEFQFPFDNPLKSDPIASEYLKTRFQSDNNQLLNQVASLLLFNTFLTSDQGLLAGSATGNFVSKTVGQLLSATLSNSLNNWLRKLIKTNNVSFSTNINATEFNQRSINERQIQNIGDFTLRTSLMHNKLLINIGGNVDRLNPAFNNTNSNFLFTPDVSFEYLISPSGNLRVVGFNRSDTDQGSFAGITRSNRTGIQLSYQRDFDSFEEFFTGQKKKKKKLRILQNNKVDSSGIGQN